MSSSSLSRIMLRVRPTSSGFFVFSNQTNNLNNKIILTNTNTALRRRTILQKQIFYYHSCCNQQEQYYLPRHNSNSQQQRLFATNGSSCSSSDSKKETVELEKGEPVTTAATTADDDDTKQPSTKTEEKKDQKSIFIPWRHSNELPKRLLNLASAKYEENSIGFSNVSYVMATVTGLSLLQIPWYQVLGKSWRYELSESCSYAFQQATIQMLSHLFDVPREKISSNSNDNGLDNSFDIDFVKIISLPKKGTTNHSTMDPNNEHATNDDNKAKLKEEKKRLFTEDFNNSSFKKSLDNIMEEKLIKMYYKSFYYDDHIVDDEFTYHPHPEDQYHYDVNCPSRSSSNSGLTNDNKDASVFSTASTDANAGENNTTDKNPDKAKSITNEKEEENKYEIKLQMKIKDFRLYTLHALPMISRELTKEELKNIAKVQEEVNQKSGKNNSLKKLDNIKKEIGKNSKNKKTKDNRIATTVIAEIVIYCDELFYIKQINDDHTDTTTNNNDDTSSNATKSSDATVPQTQEVIHTVRLEMQNYLCTKTKKRILGNWKITDIDNILNGNKFYSPLFSLKHLQEIEKLNHWWIDG